jgi:hypothetical protein
MASPDPSRKSRKGVEPKVRPEAPDAGAAGLELGIDAALLAGLGRIVILWGYVEMLLGRLAAQLCGADAMAMLTVSTELRGESLSVVVARLARQKIGGDASEQVLACLTDVDVLRRERDMLVRGRWDRGPEADAAVIVTPHPARREVMQMVTVREPDLAAIEEHAREVVQMLTRLCVDLGVGFDTPG